MLEVKKVSCTFDIERKQSVTEKDDDQTHNAHRIHRFTIISESSIKYELKYEQESSQIKLPM